jgi:cell wall-associated NlpC family hydrolase
MDSGVRPTTYTVVAGDTLWDLAHKFNTSIRSIKKLNKLKKDHLKPGQVLKIPPARATAAKPVADASATNPAHVAKTAPPAKIATTATASKTKKHHHADSLVAQPVQDFDIDPSTFASCPTPPSNGNDDAAAAPDVLSPTPALKVTTVPSSPKPETANPLARTIPSSVANSTMPPKTSPAPSATLVPPPPVKKSFASALADFFGGSKSNASESGEWGNRFLEETRNLASHGIGYDESWRPAGESRSWEMDCSNTTRYLYQVTAGIQLPRTASDQYYYLHLQDKAWDVPTVASGFADCNFLRSNLKPGDLLFWENTYKPDRQPPITHVMIFLGTNAKGQWIMAGSQSSHGGEFNPRRNGPDVYVFDPTRPSGGYTTWLGLVHHKGRFCAFGRPLEADVKKLSVAAND